MYATRKINCLYRIKSLKPLCGCKIWTGNTRRLPRGRERAVSEVETSTVDPVKKWGYLFEQKVTNEQEKVFATSFGHIRIDTDNVPSQCQEEVGNKEWEIRNKALNIAGNSMQTETTASSSATSGSQVNHIESSASSYDAFSSREDNCTEKTSSNAAQPYLGHTSRSKIISELDADFDPTSTKTNFFDVEIIDSNVAEIKPKDYFEKQMEGSNVSADAADGSSNFFDKQYFERNVSPSDDVGSLFSRDNKFGPLFSKDSTDTEEWSGDFHKVTSSKAGSEPENNQGSVGDTYVSVNDIFVGQDVRTTSSIKSDSETRFSNENSDVGQRNFFDEQYFQAPSTSEVFIQEIIRDKSSPNDTQDQVKSQKQTEEHCASDTDMIKPKADQNPSCDEMSRNDGKFSTSYVCGKFVRSIEALSDTEFEILLRESQKEESKSIRKASERGSVQNDQIDRHEQELHSYAEQDPSIFREIPKKEDIEFSTSVACRRFIESIEALSDTEFEILLKEIQKGESKPIAKESAYGSVQHGRDEKESLSLEEQGSSSCKEMSKKEDVDFSTSVVCRKFIESIEMLSDTEFKVFLNESQKEESKSILKASEQGSVQNDESDRHDKKSESLEEKDSWSSEETPKIDDDDFSTSVVCRRFIESVKDLPDTEFEILLRESQQEHIPTTGTTKARKNKKKISSVEEDMDLNVVVPLAVDKLKLDAEGPRKDRLKKVKEVKPVNSAHTTGTELIEKLKKEEERDDQPQDESIGRRRMNKFRVRYDDMTRSEILNLLKKSVVYRNDDVVAFNKPQGLVFGGSKKQKLLDIKEYVDELAQELQCPTGLHHVTILDRDTSGVMLFAKSRPLANKLRAGFQNGIVKKVYWAITRQTPKHKEGVISIPIFEGKVENRNRMALQPDTDLTPIYNKHPNRAVTSYKTLGTSKSATFLELRPQTEVRHQIRVHLSFGLGCPILGDHKYSDIKSIKPQKLSSDLMHRLSLSRSELRMLPLYLHCRSVVLSEEDGRSIVISAHPPLIFTKTLRWLRLKKD